MEWSKLNEFVNCVNSAVEDANICYEDGNKSAGRRSRKALLKISKMCKDLRKDILNLMNGE